MYAFKKLHYACLVALYVLLITQKVHSANLLTSYLPVSMQALAYYIDYLQYEPLSMTTVEPPFSANDEEVKEDNLTTSTTTTTTKRPTTSTSGWWQPPSWWHPTTTTAKPTAPPTPAHKPGVFAPPNSPRLKPPMTKLEGYALFDEIGDNPEAFDKLPLGLIRDIQTETEHDEFTNDVESLDNFLRLYDDNYGRAAFDSDTAVDRWSATSTAGKKRVPPTKPYVEFLLVYDLLKRDAKAANLSKYEGYSDELLEELHKLSFVSAERQLYTMFKRMLDRQDIQRSDVVSRIQGIVKDLGNPNSATAKALRYIPAMTFLP
ncbi:uncharacterized protein LOC119684296 [Teleopsis dalmanni]|uniref:uncharacterized protein LOC119684296 n=1 Tax=Teleopsis dalmanni TaxID=139649 RepID=UPI0018CD8239|nr:uncharacterized protein LOC119684296 [Teleopsis dalmanni]